MEEKITTICIRANHVKDSVEISVGGEANDVAAALVCGASDIAREIATRLDDHGRKLFAGEIAEIARSIDPDVLEEVEA